MSVIEQITYLLFIKRLDDLQTLEEKKAETLGKPIERHIFPIGKDKQGRAYTDLRWSRFKNFEPREMMEVVADRVFPFLRTLGEEGSSYGKHMSDARLGFSNAALLSKVVAMLDDIEMDNRDTKGDLYEYMLSKIASSGQNGQFRTPRHIIQLMVELTKPTPDDVICDPAAGTCGFLVAAGEYLREHHAKLFRNEKQRDHFHNAMFHGFDFDPTMLRIGAMNMTLHGVENADVSYRDSLAQDHTADAGRYSLVLANPPFAGSLDYEVTAKDLQQIVKTKKTELLFIALFLRLLKTGGRAAVIVPDGVLFGSSKAHQELRRILVEDHKLDAVVKLPSGVFRPYAGVSTAILLFTKTGVGGTESVWFYDVQADGYSLDDKRNAMLPDDKQGVVPAKALTEEDYAKNNLPDLLCRWAAKDSAELHNPRTAQSFHHQRVIVEHVKDGRQHFHVIWNRVSLVTGKPVWPGEHWNKSKQVCREMEKELGLMRPTPRRRSKMVFVKAHRWARPKGHYAALKRKRPKNFNTMRIGKVRELRLPFLPKPPKRKLMPFIPLWFIRQNDERKREPDSQKMPNRSQLMGLDELIAWAFANGRLDILAQYGIYLPPDYFEP